MRSLGCILLVTAMSLLPGCARQHYIEFHDDTLSLYYRDLQAKEVFFVSSMDHYTPHAALNTGRGSWKISVPVQKEFGYFYIVDGVISLPDCQFSETDDFGSHHCLYIHGM